MSKKNLSFSFVSNDVQKRVDTETDQQWDRKKDNEAERELQRITGQDLSLIHI